MSTITTIRSAEATLLASLNATADALDAVGTSDLSAALARVQAAADAAKARLSSAVSTMHATLADVLATIEGVAAGVAEMLPESSNTPAPANQRQMFSDSENFPAPAGRGQMFPDSGNIPTPADTAHVCDLTIDPATLETPVHACMAVPVPGVPANAFGGYETPSGSPDASASPGGPPERNGKARRRKAR